MALLDQCRARLQRALCLAKLHALRLWLWTGERSCGAVLIWTRPTSSIFSHRHLVTLEGCECVCVWQGCACVCVCVCVCLVRHGESPVHMLQQGSKEKRNVLAILHPTLFQVWSEIVYVCIPCKHVLVCLNVCVFNHKDFFSRGASGSHVTVLCFYQTAFDIWTKYQPSRHCIFFLDEWWWHGLIEQLFSNKHFHLSVRYFKHNNFKWVTWKILFCMLCVSGNHLTGKRLTCFPPKSYCTHLSLTQTV